MFWRKKESRTVGRSLDFYFTDAAEYKHFLEETLPKIKSELKENERLFGDNRADMGLGVLAYFVFILEQVED